MEPFWMVQHSWWIEDLLLEHADKKFFVEMLRMHPDDEIGAGYRELIKIVDKRTTILRAKYKKIYGIYPKTVYTL